MGEAREVMDRMTDAINSGDPSAVEAMYAEDAKSMDPFGTHDGRDAVMESWRAYFRAFPDAQGAVDKAYEAGDTAIDEWVFRGTHTGPLASPDGDIPPTGKSIELRGSDFARVRDGKIVEHRVYFDQMQMLGQLGLMPG